MEDHFLSFYFIISWLMILGEWIFSLLVLNASFFFFPLFLLLCVFYRSQLQQSFFDKCDKLNKIIKTNKKKKVSVNKLGNEAILYWTCPPPFYVVADPYLSFHLTSRKGSGKLFLFSSFLLFTILIVHWFISVFFLLSDV